MIFPFTASGPLADPDPRPSDSPQSAAPVDSTRPSADLAPATSLAKRVPAAWLNRVFGVGGLLALVAGLSLLLPLLHRLERHELAIALVQEDGPFETLGALACLVAALVFAALYWRGRSTTTISGRPLACLLLALVFALMFAEEISWGQRWLGFVTPGWLRGQNIQGEFNLHNLRWFHPRLETNWLKLGWLVASVVYLGLWPMAAGVFRPLARLTERLGLPTAGGGIAVAALCAFLMYGWQADEAARNQDPFAGHDAGEAVETVLELLYALLAVETAVRFWPASADRRGLAWRTVPVAALYLGLSLPDCWAAVREPTAAFDGVAWLRLGKLQLADRQSIVAIDSLARAVPLLPEEPEPLVRLAEAHFQRGEIEAAAQVLTTAVEQFPREAAGWFNLGQVRFHQRQWGAAAFAFGRLVELEPGNAEAHFRLGLAEESLGDLAGAADRYRRALELAPTFQPAAERLSRLPRSG